MCTEAGGGGWQAGLTAFSEELKRGHVANAMHEFQQGWRKRQGLTSQAWKPLNGGAGQETHRIIG